jgi:hypothetical protein
MALKDRLLSAREDYRSLDLDTDGRPLTAPPQNQGRGRRPLGAAAAAVVVGLAVAGIGWWSSTDDGTDVQSGPAPAATEKDDPEPPGAVAVHAEEISLTPPGPYVDGQVVTVSVPDGFAADLINGTPQSARQCAVLADGPGGPGEWCDPVDRAVLGTATSASVDVRLDRIVFTPTGDRDCEDQEVTCRIVLARTSGQDAASAVLRFGDTDPEPSASMELAVTDRPGSVVLSASGLAPHPSWLEYRARDPQGAAGFEAFWVSVCAFGDTDEPTDPWGGDQWGTSSSGSQVPVPNCDEFRQVATIDPDDPSSPIPVALPTWFLGYGGWSDCRSDHCFIRVRRTIVHGTEPGGGLLGSDEVVATALVPLTAVDPDGRRPELRIVTPAPHSAGQELTVQIAGLPDDRSTSIGVCQVDDPWGCGYLGGTAGPDLIGNGTHVINLPEQFACPARCYLVLDSQGEAMPPLATAALEPS